MCFQPREGQDDGEHPEHDVESRDEGQPEEPEPQENVNFFVDDVEREDAEAVELLLTGGRAHAMERAAAKRNLN